MGLSLDNPTFQFIKLTAGVGVTLGIYSVLYRETKIYRFLEHLFLGLAAGLSLVLLWTQFLYDLWWNPMVGKTADKPTQYGINGHWAWVLVLPLAAMAYTVFSRKHNWMSRIPIGILIGIAAGQAIQNWFNQYGPQIENSIRPVIPTDYSSLTVPSKVGISADAAATIDNNLYLSQAINNAIFVATLICVVSYFIFSVEYKGKLLTGMSSAGRMALMVGFGAIFGTTIMTRFGMLIDRVTFIWVDWLMDSIPKMIHGAR